DRCRGILSLTRGWRSRVVGVLAPPGPEVQGGDRTVWTLDDPAQNRRRGLSLRHRRGLGGERPVAVPALSLLSAGAHSPVVELRPLHQRPGRMPAMAQRRSHPVPREDAADVRPAGLLAALTIFHCERG